MKAEKNQSARDQNRREFLQTSATIGIGAAVLGAKMIACEEKPPELSTKPGVPTVAPIETVRIGFVGVGHQGSSHVRNCSSNALASGTAVSNQPGSAADVASVPSRVVRNPKIRAESSTDNGVEVRRT